MIRLFFPVVSYADCHIRYGISGERTGRRLASAPSRNMTVRTGQRNAACWNDLLERFDHLGMDRRGVSSFGREC
jgi:hypothetical protein